MKASERVVLVQSKASFFAAYALWILGPIISCGCAVLSGAPVESIFFGALVSSFFVGSFMSHWRSRKTLSATADGLLWREPSRAEFLGRIFSRELKWDSIEACRATRIASEIVPDCRFDILEVHVRKDAFRMASMSVNQIQSQRPGTEILLLGDESWTWTEDGKEFLEACYTSDGFLNWCRERFPQ